MTSITVTSHLKDSTEHDNINVVPCWNVQNDSAIGISVIDKHDIARFEFKIGFEPCPLTWQRVGIIHLYIYIPLLNDVIVIYVNQQQS